MTPQKSIFGIVNRLRPWQLSAVCIAFSEIITVGMSELFHGYIAPDYVVTGLVASLFVSYAVLKILSFHREDLVRHVGEQTAEIRGSEERLRSLLAALPDLMFRLDDQGRFTDYHAHDPADLLAPPEKFLGRALEEALPPALAAQTRAAMARLRDSGATETFEFEVPGPGHAIKHYECRMVRPPSGGYLLIDRDVTARKRAFEMLDESEGRFRATFDHAAVGIAHSATDGRFLRVNRKFAEMLGRTEKELSRLGVLDVTHPDDVSVCVAAMQRALRREAESFTVDKRFLCKDGSVIWVRSTVSLVVDDLNQPAYFVAVVEDITAQHEMTAALQSSQAGLANAQRIARLGNWDWDIAANRFTWSDEIRRMFGLDTVMLHATLEEFLARVHPDDRESVANAISRALNGIEPYNVVYRIPLSEGGETVVHAQGEVYYDGAGRPVRMSGTVQDVTEHVRTERALRQQNEMLTAVAEAQNYFLENADWKAAMQRLLRFALEQTQSEYGFIGVMVEGPKLRILAHEGIVWDKFVGQEFYQRAVRAYREQGYLEFANFNNLFGAAVTSGATVVANAPAEDARSGGLPEGHPPMLSFLGVPVLRGGKGIGLIAVANRPGGYSETEVARIAATMQHAAVLCDGYLRGIAEAKLRKERDAAEQAKEEALATLDSIEDAAFIFDPETLRLAYVNQGALAQLGYSRAELLEMTPLDIKPDYDEAGFRKVLEPMLRGETGTARYVTRHRHKDGRDIPVEVNLQLVAPPGKWPRFIALARDVTERTKMETRLRQAQKMETVGKLAGGVAHDFNNLLMVIAGSLELLIDDLPAQGRERGRVLRLADNALRAARQSKNLVDQLLVFSRRQALQTEAVDVGALIYKMKDILRSTLKESVAVKIGADAGLWHAAVDPIRLENALLNLALNARDAMPEGGTLAITADNVDLAADRLPAGSDVPPGSFVRIAVSDTGTGMPPEVIERAFEPFFTTKEVGKGSGLGLSMVYGLVKQSGGHVEIVSAPGRGTRVDLYLPKAEAPRAVKKRERRRPVVPMAGRTVLIVEDNVAVRRVAVALLRHLGHRVLEAAEGPAALAVLESGEFLDLLLTDIVMPGGMNGWELARRALALRPGLKVLFVTGYADQAPPPDLAEATAENILTKPYRKDELIAALQRVFEGSAASSPEPEPESESRAPAH